MKAKKDNKTKREQLSKAMKPKAKNREKSSKQLKLNMNNVEETTSHSSETNALVLNSKSSQIVDATIFQYFKELTSENEQKRLQAALQLLQQLNKTKDTEKREKELAYTLKRLIRGCGASTNASRAGFFTALAAFLRSRNPEEVPLAKVFEILQKELHVGSTITNKEDADAVVGKILSCGALIHAGRIDDIQSEHMEHIANVFIQATRHRTYHCSLGYSFLIELLEKTTEEQFQQTIWPNLQKELVKPWQKQSLQTIHCLIFIHKKFPNVVDNKFFKIHFGAGDLLSSQSHPHLLKIFWQNSNADILMHPAFELFGAHIAQSKNLSDFWIQFVDPNLKNPTKLLEIQTLRIATSILQNLNIERTNIVDLLSTNFITFLIEGLRNLKQKKDETLKAFYHEYLEALITCSNRIENDAQKVLVIRRLILPPGIFNIEKFTSTRIIHQLINKLGMEGVKELYSLYKEIFLGSYPKNPDNANETWLHFERLNAGYMLQHLLAHKATQGALKWREQQLRFLLIAGLCHTGDDGVEVACKRDAANVFSKEFGEQCLNMFYASLQNKFIDLQLEKKLLYNLVKLLNDRVEHKHAHKYFRTKNFNDQLIKAWQRMYGVISGNDEPTQLKTKKRKESSSAEKQDKIQLIFHILLMTMGLQLFREVEMAAPAIDDLLKCMEKTTNGLPSSRERKKLKTNDETIEEKEPEWIEVVVDLFLHLLSQNSSALRNIVDALFPHLCSHLNLSAIHQILSMLEMKDGFNPLTTKGEEDSEDESDDQEEQDALKYHKESETSDQSENEEDDDDDEEDEEEEEEDEEEEEEDDGEITASDKLRNAISQALMANGAAGGVGGNDNNSDTDIDLNDMTEEEGRKLDEALANAFKAMKKSTASGGDGSANKKSKIHRVKTTTVLHFRIRVLDLLEIYLQQQPTLLVSIEIMLTLYNMLEYCQGEELRPLHNKVDRVLQKLTNQKQCAIDADLTEDHLVSFFRKIVEKKSPGTTYNLVNSARNKCAIFLINSANRIVQNNNADKMIELCKEYLKEFVRSRNPTVNITLLTEILKSRWSGVWALTACLAKEGLNSKTRIFRRIQVHELLSVLYKNYELQKLDEDMTKNHLNNLEQVLSTYVKEHASNLAAQQHNGIKQSPKEFQTLLELLLNAHKANGRLGRQAMSAVCTADVSEAVQVLRKHVRLESMQLYQRYCGVFKLKLIRNIEAKPIENGIQNTEERSSEERSSEQSQSEEEEADHEDEGTKKKTKRNKRFNGKETELSSKTIKNKQNEINNDLRKKRKAKKAQRMEASAKGLNGGIKFTQRPSKTTASNIITNDVVSKETDSDESASS